MLLIMVIFNNLVDVINISFLVCLTYNLLFYILLIDKFKSADKFKLIDTRSL